ncbi:MAG: hypothetical protein ACRD0P_28305, partial [Stackebrandtia sp.]
MLIDQIGDEPGQMPRRQPLIQRRRQQQVLLRGERAKRFVHRALRYRLAADALRTRRNLKQALIISIAWHT